MTFKAKLKIILLSLDKLIIYLNSYSRLDLEVISGFAT